MDINKDRLEDYVFDICCNSTCDLCPVGADCYNFENEYECTTKIINYLKENKNE